MPNPNLPLIASVTALADGTKSSVEIAALLGIQPRHARKIMTKYALPRLPHGSPVGKRNGSFAGGRRINLNGYAEVSAPISHPHASLLPGKNIPKILEHRLVAEQTLGRYLLPEERVDHIDGLTLHNHPDNLRVYANNAEHLRVTLTGKVPRWSDVGYENMLLRHRPDVALQRVDTHRQRRAAGVVRLRQILLLALSLGIDSPFLLGTTAHTTKAGIDMSSRSTIRRALDDLCRQWAWGHTLSEPASPPQRSHTDPL